MREADASLRADRAWQGDAVKCRHCDEKGNHYVGGGVWLCFRHFLALFATAPGSGDGK